MDKSPSANKIIKMYDKLTYLDQYGGSVMICILLFIILFVSYSYTQVMSNIQPIKNDWPTQRCAPSVIPFAGLINKPADKTIIDFTGENFTYCMNNILTSISGYAVQPFTDITFMIEGIFSALGEAIQFLREIIADIRGTISRILEYVYNVILTVLIPIQQVLITLVDFMNKVKGILTAGLYTSLGSYYILQTLLESVSQMLVGVLVILFGVVMACWMIFPLWPAAAAGTVLFTVIAVFTTLILNFLTDDMHVNMNLQTPAGPVKPAGCFDKNTLIKMYDDSYKPIINIEVGDKLANNSIVTAKFKIDAIKHQMYNLNGVIVSESHLLKHDDKWITVENYYKNNKWRFYFNKKCIKIRNYLEPYLYCMNTSTKEIHINGIVFNDWDDLDDSDIQHFHNIHINNNYNTHNKIEIDQTAENIIHRYFDGGFVEDTRIVLIDGTSKNINDINIGDTLSRGEVVYGTVEIDGDSLSSQHSFDLGLNGYINGGPNLNLCDKKFIVNNGDDILCNVIDTTLTLGNNKKILLKTPHKKLYHLLTNTETFYVENIWKFHHYNASIDLFLDKTRGKLLSMKYV
jgi:hypothetical protein